MKATIILLSFLLFVSCESKKDKAVITEDKLEIKKTTKIVVKDTVIEKTDTVKKKEVIVKKTPQKKSVSKPITTAKKSVTSSNKKTKTYRFRKYNHVKKFYERLSVNATKICMEENIPPAALLAIAGLESGWNNGYIGKITGNILSLGASSRRGDAELPALRLPRVIKTKKILFDDKNIAKYKKSELRYENRPASLKKDYRPAPYAGTKNNLEYLENNPDAKAAAQAQNMKDFVTVFISRTSRIRAYRTSRAHMDALVKKHGKSILLEDKTAMAFIHGIGGKNNSYNFRKEWPIKVISIIRSAGLCPLTKDLYDGKTFDESW